MAIIFSMGNMGDPLDVLEAYRKLDAGYKLGNLSDIDAEIKRFKAWHNDEVDHILRTAELGDLESLVECQDRALQLEAALTFTATNASRSRLSPEAFFQLEKGAIISIDLLKSAGDLIRQRLEILSRPGATQPARITRSPGLSYCWLSDPQIPVLYNLLLGTWISEDTIEKDFGEVFNQTPIVDISPIKWLGTASSLLYFLSQSMEHGFLYPPAERFSYKQMKSCFKKQDGSEFSESLKQLKSLPDCKASRADVEALTFILDSLPKKKK
ncbi:hypothetical protein [Dyadobacter sp. 676]|uniref:Uncharacterized protein n=1 Tax=Dyadobacter sp. 676 TaxID=3088362 RepID=A0AAU8FPY5_9BACT